MDKETDRERSRRIMHHFLNEIDELQDPETIETISIAFFLSAFQKSLPEERIKLKHRINLLMEIIGNERFEDPADFNDFLGRKFESMGI